MAPAQMRFDKQPVPDVGSSGGGPTDRPTVVQRRRESLFVAGFIILHVASYFLIGELYPFSLSPMFQDRVQADCEYRVYDPDGRELALEDFLLQQIYDGNPVGLGVGLIPPSTLDRPNHVPTAAEIEQHVQQRLVLFPDLPWVRVVRTVVEQSGANVGARPETLQVHVYQPLSPVSLSP